MTKKQNTLVFLLISTVANVLMLLILIAVMTLVLLFAFKGKENVVQVAFPIAFVLALVLNVVLYQKLLKFVMKKWNLTEKLDPLFRRRR